MKLFLIGLTHRTKRVSTYRGESFDFVYGEAIEQVPVLVFRDENGKRWTLTFWVDEVPCTSDWCAATWANYELRRESVPFDEVPVKPGQFIYIHKFRGEWYIGHKPNFTEADNEVFSYSFEGGDGYYPCGSFFIKAKFRPTVRSMEKRPIWVFYGKSGSGKSTLAHETNRLTYETDQSAKLPSNLGDYDIIIVGNKFKHSKEEIKKALPKDVKVIWVNFN